MTHSVVHTTRRRTQSTTSLVGPVIASLIKVVVAVVAGYVAYLGIAQTADVRITGTSLMAVSGTLTGFIMTAMSMLVSASNRDFMKKLRKTGHFSELIKELVNSAAWWIAVIVCALSSHLLAGEYAKYAVAVAVGLFAASLITFVLAGKKFLTVVDFLGRED